MNKLIQFGKDCFDVLLFILVVLILLSSVLGIVARAEPIRNVGEAKQALQNLADDTPIVMQNEEGGTDVVDANMSRTSLVLSVYREDPQPPDPVVTHSQPHGLFALQPGFHGASAEGVTDPSFPRGTRLISLSQLQDPDCAGLTIRWARKQVVKDNGQWNEDVFRQIQACIDRASQANKLYTMLPMRTSDSDIQYHNAMDLEVARRWGNDKSFAMYHVTGTSPSDSSEELHHKNGMSQQLIDQTVARVRHARNALPGVTLTVAIGGLQKNEASIMKIGQAVKDVDYIVWKHNALKAFDPGSNTFQTWPNVRHNKTLIELVKLNPTWTVGFEMVSAANVVSRTGSRDINDSLRQAAVVIRRANLDPTRAYIAVYPPDIFAMRQQTLAFVNRVWGEAIAWHEDQQLNANAATTASSWIPRDLNLPDVIPCESQARVKD